MKVEADESVFKLFYLILLTFWYCLAMHSVMLKVLEITYWLAKGFVMHLLFKFWTSAVQTMLLIPVLRVN
jgi:hypothetical protein